MLKLSCITIVWLGVDAIYHALCCCSRLKRGRANAMVEPVNSSGDCGYQQALAVARHEHKIKTCGVEGTMMDRAARFGERGRSYVPEYSLGVCAHSALYKVTTDAVSLASVCRSVCWLVKCLWLGLIFRPRSAGWALADYVCFRRLVCLEICIFLQLQSKRAVR